MCFVGLDSALGRNEQCYSLLSKVVRNLAPKQDLFNSMVITTTPDDIYWLQVKVSDNRWLTGLLISQLANASVLAARTTAAVQQDVASRQKKRNLQIRGAMDGVCDELERPSRQTLPAGTGEFCGGIQQQGA